MNSIGCTITLHSICFIFIIYGMKQKRKNETITKRKIWQN